MSCRNIWIISLLAENQGKVIFSRHFPTVERRAQLIFDDKYVGICDNTEFSTHLCQDLGLFGTSSQFSSFRDSCKIVNQKPIFEVTTSLGSLWPVLVCQQNSYLFCCLPLLELGSNVPVIQHSSVSLAFTLLLGIIEFLGPLPDNPSEVSSKLIDLSHFLCHIMPLGSPCDINSTSALFYSRLSLNEKLPAWKPQLLQGKPSFHISITENIRSNQYNHVDQVDSWNVFGSVVCRAELEGALPMVTLSLTSCEKDHDLPLDSLLVHPCVQTADIDAPVTALGGMVRPQRKLRFTPPLEAFTLCHYIVEDKTVLEFPVQGLYKVREEVQTQFLLQLKVSYQSKNMLEYLEVEFPFFNHGPIKTVDCKPVTGNVLLSSDKKKLLWNIGSKFPSKQSEVTLTGSLQFEDQSFENVDEGRMYINLYAQIHFKMSDFTCSGICIEPKSIQVAPSTKTKITTARELFSRDYKIWNSHLDNLAS